MAAAMRRPVSAAEDALNTRPALHGLLGACCCSEADDHKEAAFGAFSSAFSGVQALAHERLLPRTSSSFGSPAASPGGGAGPIGLKLSDLGAGEVDAATGRSPTARAAPQAVSREQLEALELAGDMVEGGARYEGQWRRDQAHGRGKYTYADGSTYEGQWRSDQRTGRGIEVSSGCRYEGEFLHGLRHGQGSFSSDGGDASYVGEFKHGMMDGHGRFQFDDGRLYVGQWWRNNMDGTGCMDWPDGSRYEGSFLAGMRHGEGAFIWADGRLHKGQWCSGKQDGSGALTSRTGRKYVGTWREGCPLAVQPV
mmetsp:Transcript_63876/g.178732  ORF Transcript_63876/g.178732 Transcript_63876/m.178732 type:complete len:309 (-) Transcript_63876:128-1054(-)